MLLAQIDELLKAVPQPWAGIIAGLMVALLIWQRVRIALAQKTRDANVVAIEVLLEEIKKLSTDEHRNKIVEALMSLQEKKGVVKEVEKDMVRTELEREAISRNNDKPTVIP